MRERDVGSICWTDLMALQLVLSWQNRSMLWMCDMSEHTDGCTRICLTPHQLHSYNYNNTIQRNAEGSLWKRCIREPSRRRSTFSYYRFIRAWLRKKKKKAHQRKNKASQKLTDPCFSLLSLPSRTLLGFKRELKMVEMKLLRHATVKDALAAGGAVIFPWAWHFHNNLGLWISAGVGRRMRKKFIKPSTNNSQTAKAHAEALVKILCHSWGSEAERGHGLVHEGHSSTEMSALNNNKYRDTCTESERT